MIRNDESAVADAMGTAARRAGVAIVTGDTKVVERGKGDGCYVNTAGRALHPQAAAQPRDALPHPLETEMPLLGAARPRGREARAVVHDPHADGP